VDTIVIAAAAQFKMGSPDAYLVGAGHDCLAVLNEGLVAIEPVGARPDEAFGNTAFGAFKVDADGFQVAHKMQTFQWHEGKKKIVWPEQLAADRPVFPTPPWSQRK